MGISERLEALKNKHKELDERVNHLTKQRMVDWTEVQKTKKEKLFVKDQIVELENSLFTSQEGHSTEL